MNTCLTPLLLNCLALAAPQAQRAQVDLKPPRADHGMRVQADEDLLAQALGRLLDHAIDQHQPGAELTLRAVRQGARACLGVQVCGRGSAAADLGSPALEAAHQLVQRLGGSLGASTAARGARTFHIWLPLASNDPFHPEPASSRPNLRRVSQPALQAG